MKNAPVPQALSRLKAGDVFVLRVGTHGMVVDPRRTQVRVRWVKTGRTEWVDSFKFYGRIVAVIPAPYKIPGGCDGTAHP